MNSLTVLCALVVPGQVSPPQFEVATTDDKVLVGTIHQMDLDGKLTVRGQPPVAGNDVVSLRQIAVPRPPSPHTAQVVLFNGDRLAGRPIEMVGSALNFRAAVLHRLDDEKRDGPLQIPLTAIAFLWLRAPESLDRERYPAFFAASRTNDQAVLRNGDLISGTLTALNGQQIEFESESGQGRRSIALDKVTALAFSTKLARNRKPVGAYGHVVLANGSRLTVSSWSIKDDLLSATTTFRDRVQISMSDVAAIDVYQGKAVFLSDLKPSHFQYRTYQGEEFGWAADRNLEGGDLQLKTPIGVQTYDKGISVHGECSMTYAIDGAYRRFECMVGLDARLGKRGSVELHVLADGKEQPVGDGKPLCVETGPWRLKIDVKRAKTLTLKVNWGEGGNIGDHVNWCEARLIP